MDEDTKKLIDLLAYEEISKKLKQYIDDNDIEVTIATSDDIKKLFTEGN